MSGTVGGTCCYRWFKGFEGVFTIVFTVVKCEGFYVKYLREFWFENII